MKGDACLFSLALVSACPWKQGCVALACPGVCSPGLPGSVVGETHRCRGASTEGCWQGWYPLTLGQGRGF